MKKQNDLVPKPVTLKAQPGEYGYAKSPVLQFIPNGKNTYLWIGNNADGNKLCFATISGTKSIEKFAKALLKELKKKK
jgi:hypothetical protein